MAFLSSAGCTLPGQIGRNHGCGHLCARVRPSRPSPARVTACAAASTPMPEDTLEAMSGGAGFIEHDDGVIDILGGDYDIIEEKTKKVRQRTSELLDAINKERESNLASDADSLPPLEQDETIGWVRTAVRAGDERKALNPVAIRVMRVTYITSWMVALTGKSAPQLRAIANLVEENMFKEHDATPKRSSGSPQSGWILLDCT